MYSKLSSSIIHSTVWREPNHIRILWITMLAICDRNGVVSASLPGLADAAKITVEECKAGLAVLEAPDPYSRTKDYDGARITEMDGGWLILNYCSYRDKKDDDSERDKARERQRRKRDKDKCNGLSRPVTDVTQCSTLAPSQISSAPAEINNTSCAAPPSTAETAPQLSPTVLSFPIKGRNGGLWGLTEAHVAEYATAFPGIDILGECRKARLWCVDHPTKQKTRNGIKGFLTAWLGRAQDRPSLLGYPERKPEEPRRAIGLREDN